MKLLEVFNNLCLEETHSGEEETSISRLRRLKKKNKKLTPLDEKFFCGERMKQKIRIFPPNNIFKVNHISRAK